MDTNARNIPAHKMNARQHLQATKLLLGLESPTGLHAFMDEYARELKSAHRILRHNNETIDFARRLYGEGGALEAAFHIACDMKLVTVEDIEWARTKKRRKSTTSRAKS